MFVYLKFMDWNTRKIGGASVGGERLRISRNSVWPLVCDQLLTGACISQCSAAQRPEHALSYYHTSMTSFGVKHTVSHF